MTNDNNGCAFAISLIILVVCVLASFAYTEMVVNADIPEWLKFWLLT